MKFLFVKLILLTFFILSFPTTNANEKTVFFPGEKLVYDVKYIGIKLGQITVTSDSVSFYDGREVNNATAVMKSSDGIPFVDLHAFFYSWIDPSLSYSHKFIGNMKEDKNDWLYEKALIDYKKKQVSIEVWKEKELIKSKNVDIEKRLNDGCSLYFFARQHTRMGKSVKVPTLIDGEIYPTIINFKNKKENVNINAVEYDIKTIYFDGQAQWEGIYGLSGNFEGWFSDDDARIPILAKMKVYVGNVNIELVEWKRGNWQPPKAK